MANNKRFKNRRRKSSNKRTYVGKEFYKYLWGLSKKNAESAYKYTETRAAQMGRNISPSEKQKDIRESTRYGYHKAKKDLRFMRFLINNYDSDIKNL